MLLRLRVMPHSSDTAWILCRINTAVTEERSVRISINQSIIYLSQATWPIHRHSHTRTQYTISCEYIFISASEASYRSARWHTVALTLAVAWLPVLIHHPISINCVSARRRRRRCHPWLLPLLRPCNITVRRGAEWSPYDHPSNNRSHTEMNIIGVDCSTTASWIGSAQETGDWRSVDGRTSERQIKTSKP